MNPDSPLPLSAPTTKCPPMEFDANGRLIPIQFDDMDTHEMQHIATTNGGTWVEVCRWCGRHGYVGK